MLFQSVNSMDLVRKPPKLTVHCTRERAAQLQRQIVTLQERIERDEPQILRDTKRLRIAKAKKYQREAICMHAAPSSLNPVMARAARETLRQAKDQLARAQAELAKLTREA